MRQAVIVAPDRFIPCDAPRPALRGDGEILLRTLACGICSGDLMPWYLAKKVGTVLGHEPVGRAVEVGPAVAHIRPGDLVFVHHHAPCLTCPECARGAFVHCATWKATKLDPGGMAEFIRVPAEIVRGDAFAVNDLHPEQALFIEPLGCCVKALRRVGGRPSTRQARRRRRLRHHGPAQHPDGARLRGRRGGRRRAGRRTGAQAAVRAGAADALTPDEAAQTAARGATSSSSAPAIPRSSARRWATSATAGSPACSRRRPTGVADRTRPRRSLFPRGEPGAVVLVRARRHAGRV